MYVEAHPTPVPAPDRTEVPPTNRRGRTGYRVLGVAGVHTARWSTAIGGEIVVEETDERTGVRTIWSLSVLNRRADADPSGFEAAVLRAVEGGAGPRGPGAVRGCALTPATARPRYITDGGRVLAYENGNYVLYGTTIYVGRIGDGVQMQIKGGQWRCKGRTGGVMWCYDGAARSDLSPLNYGMRWVRP